MPDRVGAPGAPRLPGERLILALVGPTAAGKTEAAMLLADRYPVSLISLDSAMVYRGMDIGTAKPSAEELRQYPHALIDIREPHEIYTVAEWVAEADLAVRAAFAAGRVPLLVGGSMLYLKAFREGIAAMPPADREIRAALEAEAAQHGPRHLYERLLRLDPEAAAGIHPNNFPRIQRALEVHALTGATISSHWKSTRGAHDRHAAALLEFGVEPDSRAGLHRRIERRLQVMLEQGFVDEVARLRARVQMNRSLPSMRAVGYRQVWDYLDGQGSERQMRENVLAATRQLARRQLTWMRSWPQLLTLASGSAAEVARGIALKAGLTV
ncbi:MAG TPA: tRNA (adenosine(37)-N6)-dimethylallyltransferase MiaA [Pseudomonadales bacterium]